jgi:uncharacterized protein YdiU (UPF0061 family)
MNVPRDRLGGIAAPPVFGFDNTYAAELPGLYVDWPPAQVPAPRLVWLNGALADELGLDARALAGDAGARIFAGNETPPGATPIAQAYAGHQFGGFSPQLGDGRALLLGEVVDRHGRRRDIAFKGSGRTPFARGGDGKAAIGPVLREALIGEAMHALGVPTTRALAAATTGEPVYRETPLPGAVLTRVAASHIRVGTFEYFAMRGEFDRLRLLADYAIRRHDPDLVGRDDRYLGFLRAVARRQAALVARWMHVGFIHGVMNTDNMAVSGETIDFGPCAFIEAYDPRTVFSSIDTHGRYAYGNQPSMARWNLARLAEALLPLVDPEDPKRAVPAAVEIIDAFPAWFEDVWLAGARAKLGLATARGGDLTLAVDWLALLAKQAMDFTLAFRRLADAAGGEDAPLRALTRDPSALDGWLSRWRARCAEEDAGSNEADRSSRAARMRAVDPIVIPRNHLVEEALAAATLAADYAPFEAMLAAVVRPYDERPGLERYARPAPVEVTAGYRTFCGT